MLDKDGFVRRDVVSSNDWNDLVSTLALDSWYDQLHFQTLKTSAGHSWPYAAVEQEFRTCFARHSMTSEHHSTILEFLMTASDQMNSDEMEDDEEGGSFGRRVMTQSSSSPHE